MGRSWRKRAKKRWDSPGWIFARAFENHEGIADFGGEEIGGDELVDAVAKGVAELDRFGRIGFRDEGLDFNRSIDDVFHWLFRISRTKSTATF